MGQMRFKISQSQGKNRPVSCKIFTFLGLSSAIDLVMGDSDVKNIARRKTLPCHQCCLNFGAREVLDDPSTLQTVSCLRSLGQELNHQLVVDASSFLFHSFSQSLALCTISSDILLYDLIHLQMDSASLFGNSCAQS